MSKLQEKQYEDLSRNISPRAEEASETATDQTPHTHYRRYVKAVREERVADQITTYRAEDILHMTEDEVWRLPDSKMCIVFDDVTIETTGRRTIFTWYFWELKRIYPRIRLTSEHHTGMRRMSTKLQLDLLSELYRSWFDAYYGTPEYHYANCNRYVYTIVNWIYNTFIQRLDQHVMSISSIDMLECLEHPKIHETNRTIKPSQKSIEMAYESAMTVFKEDPALEKNSICQYLKSSLLDQQQVCQVLVARSFATDIDSTIFQNPITTNYALGMRSFHDSLIESRMASKSMTYQKDPLEDCEYLNRRLQLVGMFVKNLHYVDCGTPHTTEWIIRPNELSIMAGIHHMVDGKAIPITEKDKHLIGQTIQIRTPFNCQHPDPQGICLTCFGQIGYNFPVGVNLGHRCAIAIGKEITQATLSVKHVDGISRMDPIDFAEEYLTYLTVGSDNRTLRLNHRLQEMSVQLRVRVRDLDGLIAILHYNSFDEISIQKISEMSDVILCIDGESIAIPVSMGSRRGSFTKDFLYHIKNRPPIKTEDGYYEISLAGWDYGLSFVELPLKHLSMLDYQNTISQKLLSNKNDTSAAGKRAGGDFNRPLSHYKNRIEGIRDFMTLICSKLQVNFSHIVTMAYSVSAVDPRNNNYHLPKGGDPSVFLTISQIAKHRSLSMAMGYERQDGVLSMLETFLDEDRLQHPFDDCVIKE